MVALYIYQGLYANGPKAHQHKIQGAENGFNRIETPSEAYHETYFADSSLGLDSYFN